MTFDEKYIIRTLLQQIKNIELWEDQEYLVKWKSKDFLIVRHEKEKLKALAEIVQERES